MSSFKGPEDAQAVSDFHKGQVQALLSAQGIAASVLNIETGGDGLVTTFGVADTADWPVRHAVIATVDEYGQQLVPPADIVCLFRERTPVPEEQS